MKPFVKPIRAVAFSDGQQRVIARLVQVNDGFEVLAVHHVDGREKTGCQLRHETLDEATSYFHDLCAKLGDAGWLPLQHELERYDGPRLSPDPRILKLALQRGPVIRFAHLLAVLD